LPSTTSEFFSSQTRLTSLQRLIFSIRIWMILAVFTPFSRLGSLSLLGRFFFDAFFFAIVIPFWEVGRRGGVPARRGVHWLVS
jgi:hypothetical protein